VLRHAAVDEVLALPNDILIAFHLERGFTEVVTFVAYAHQWDRDISTTRF